MGNGWNRKRKEVGNPPQLRSPPTFQPWLRLRHCTVAVMVSPHRHKDNRPLLGCQRSPRVRLTTDDSQPGSWRFRTGPAVVLLLMSSRSFSLCVWLGDLVTRDVVDVIVTISTPHSRLHQPLWLLQSILLSKGSSDQRRRHKSTIKSRRKEMYQQK